MKPENFEYISALAKERSGLVMREDKVYLLESRLMPLARREGIATLDEFVEFLRRENDFNAINDVVDALTTNETLFFRDNGPFEAFRNTIMPHILETRATTKKFRVWSAASSSGQEPYSLVMILDEMKAALTGWNYEIIGTDISMRILEKAQAATYSQFEVQRGMPTDKLIKYFEQDGQHWRLKAPFREQVSFRKANLLEDQRALGMFDVVFCRNVLIYFDRETKTQVLEMIAQVLEMIAQMMPADGKLFLGGAETVLGLTDRFAAVEGVKGMYQKVP